MISQFKHVKIKGISVVVPQKEINIYDEAEYYDNSIKKIDRMRKMVGFYKRRVVEDGTTASDLAIQAAKQLIQDMNIDINSIDSLVYVNQRPDFKQPATSFCIHNKLGLSSKCSVLDINHGCPGWMYGLWTASSIIESKSCKRILLLVGDTPSAGMDLSNRISAPVFGDGGCATLLEFNESEWNSYFDISTFSDGFEAIMTPAGGARLPLNIKNIDNDFNKKLLKPIKTKAGHETTLFSGYMDGLAVFDFTINKVPESIKKLMEFAKVTEQDIDKLMLHQANKQIVQAVGQSAGFSLDKVPYDAFENYGNNTMCSIPTNLTYLYTNKMDSKKKFICSGFGNGLAVVSGYLEIDKNIYLSGVKNYKKPADYVSKEEYLEYWIKKLEG